MTAEEFVAAIKMTVHDAAVGAVLEAVEAPSGRKPPPSVVQLSSWYKALPESDKRHVQAMVLQGVHAALFGLFAVIDGARVVEDGPEKSEFVLLQRRGGVETQITDPANPLHDIYQAEVWSQVFGGIPRP
jgi:hypothetical protein